MKLLHPEEVHFLHVVVLVVGVLLDVAANQQIVDGALHVEAHVSAPSSKQIPEIIVRIPVMSQEKLGRG